jgi:hypothetical protein
MQHDVATGVFQALYSNALSARDADRERLNEEQEEYDMDPQQDTAAIIERLERRIKNASIRIEAMEAILDILEDYVPAPDETWTELEFRPDGEFYIEKLKASTSEYWPYRVQSYGDTSNAWRVIDATTDAPIGIIYPRVNNEGFRAVVNGKSHAETFASLKGAVIYIAEEYKW